MRVIALEGANTKRMKAFRIEPTGPMVKLMGKNAQGKTSILDALMWVLGGGKTIPAVPIREGESEAVVRVWLGDKEPEIIAQLKITEKAPYLTLRNADGSKPPGGPQDLLNKLVGKLAFDPVNFMRDKPSDQLAVLRALVVLTDAEGAPLDLKVLDAQRLAAFTERTDANRDQRGAQARAEAISVPADVPAEAPSVTELMTEMGEVADFNSKLVAETARRDQRKAVLQQEEDHIPRVEAEIADLTDKLADANHRLEKTQEARNSLLDEILGWPDMAEPKEMAAVQAKVAQARNIELAIATRTAKAELVAEAQTYAGISDEMTKIIAAIDQAKIEAVARAKMPIPGLSFGDGMVLFNALPLDQASDAEQLRVSVAIAAALNPTLRVMRVRDGSILDSVAMAALETFGAENDYQIWIEVVDESGEGGIVIEDGGVRGQALTPEAILGSKEATAQGSAKPASAPAAPPDAARQEAAGSFLIGAIAELAEIRRDAPDGKDQIAKLHGTVKAKLKNFPDLIAEVWNPAKLEKEASLKPKASRE